MSDFDWVRARSDCTVENVFEQLARAVQDDFQIYCARHPGPAQAREFGPCGKDRFYVGHRQVHRVVFERADSEIRIGRWAYMGEHTPLMILKARLAENGNCVLIDEDQKVWKLWQIRRKALEETLFGATELNSGARS